MLELKKASRGRKPNQRRIPMSEITDFMDEYVRQHRPCLTGTVERKTIEKFGVARSTVNIAWAKIRGIKVIQATKGDLEQMGRRDIKPELNQKYWIPADSSIIRMEYERSWRALNQNLHKPEAFAPLFENFLNFSNSRYTPSMREQDIKEINILLVSLLFGNDDFKKTFPGEERIDVTLPDPNLKYRYSIGLSNFLCQISNDNLNLIKNFGDIYLKLLICFIPSLIDIDRQSYNRIELLENIFVLADKTCIVDVEDLVFKTFKQAITRGGQDSPGLLKFIGNLDHFLSVVKSSYDLKKSGSMMWLSMYSAMMGTFDDLSLSEFSVEERDKAGLLIERMITDGQYSTILQCFRKMEKYFIRSER